jgi:hypothetical protein
MNRSRMVGLAILCEPAAARGLAALPSAGSWRDSAAGREQFERRMELCRVAEEDEQVLNG